MLHGLITDASPRDGVHARFGVVFGLRAKAIECLRTADGFLEGAAGQLHLIAWPAQQMYVLLCRVMLGGHLSVMLAGVKAL